MFLKIKTQIKPINVLVNHKTPKIVKLIIVGIPPCDLCATIMPVTDPITANITYIRPVIRCALRFFERK